MCIVIKRHKQDKIINAVMNLQYSWLHLLTCFELSVLINVLCSVLCGLCAFFHAAFQTELPTGNMVLCGIVPYEDDANKQCFGTLNSSLSTPIIINSNRRE